MASINPRHAHATKEGHIQHVHAGQAYNAPDAYMRPNALCKI